MNKLIKYLSVPVLAVALIFASCQTTDSGSDTVTLDPQAIESGVAIATQAGLQFAVQNSATRQNIANYVYVYAGALRTVTGTPSPEELTKYLNTFIPMDVKTKFPEIPAFVTPMIVTRYATIYAKFGNDAKKIYEYLNSIASGLEQGAKGFISPASPTPAS